MASRTQRSRRLLWGICGVVAWHCVLIGLSLWSAALSENRSTAGSADPTNKPALNKKSASNKKPDSEKPDADMPDAGKPDADKPAATLSDLGRTAADLWKSLTAPGKVDPPKPNLSPSLKRPELGFDPPSFAALRRDRPDGEPFGFLLMGDQHFAGGKDSVRFFELFLKKYAEGGLPEFDFVVTLGDQINNGGNYREWLDYGGHPATKAWFDKMAAAGKPIFPLAGNHELGGRSVSSAERSLLGEDKEIERLIAAATDEPELREARLVVYRALREDLRKSVLSTNRPDWGRYFEVKFYEPLFAANADRLRHVPDAERAEMWYSFRHGGCLFLMVDGNHNTRNSWRLATRPDSVGLQQLLWMQQELTAARRDGIRHVFVCVHQPLFVSDSTHESDTRDMRSVRYPAGEPIRGAFARLMSWGRLAAEAARAAKDSKADPALKRPVPLPEREPIHWAELLRRHPVTAVFCGHVHRYERFLWETGDGNRITCVTTGGSSASRGRSAINLDPESLTVKHIERTRRGSGLLGPPRVDVLSTLPGQRVHQMYPRTDRQARELADKKLFVLHVRVAGPQVSLTLIPLEDLLRDGKRATVYEEVRDLRTEPLPERGPTVPTPEFARRVLSEVGIPTWATITRVQGGSDDLLTVDVSAGLTLANLAEPAKRSVLLAEPRLTQVLPVRVDGNRRRDLLVGGLSRSASSGRSDWAWLANPGGPTGRDPWKVLPVGRAADGWDEPQWGVWADVDADGKPEPVFVTRDSGQIVYTRIPSDPAKPEEWRRRELFKSELPKPDGAKHDSAKPDGKSDAAKSETKPDAKPDSKNDDNSDDKPEPKSEPKSELPPSIGVRSVAAAVLAPQDGKKEPTAIFVGCSGSRDVLWVLEPGRRSASTGKYRWSRTVIESGSGDTAELAVGDFDGDGLTDVAVADRGVAHASNVGLTLYVQGPPALDGRSTWKKRTLDKNLKTASSLAAVDLDGDGRLDLVVVHREDRSNRLTVVWYANSGDGFERSVVGDLGPDGAIPSEAGRLSVDDFNGDDRPDVLATGLVNGRVVLFENRPKPVAVPSKSNSPKK